MTPEDLRVIMILLVLSGAGGVIVTTIFSFVHGRLPTWAHTLLLSWWLRPPKDSPALEVCRLLDADTECNRFNGQGSHFSYRGANLSISVRLYSSSPSELEVGSHLVRATALEAYALRKAASRWSRRERLLSRKRVTAKFAENRHLALEKIRAHMDR